MDGEHVGGLRQQRDDSAAQGGRSERRTHEERRRNDDVTRWLLLRAVTSRMTNVSLQLLLLLKEVGNARLGESD